MGRRRNRPPPSHHGVALVDKPAGVTSHDVVQKLRRGLGQREIGHTGTLDPAATGLMVVTLGRATRTARFLEATEKEYLGEVYLGSSTTTWDAEGETVEEVSLPEISKAQVEATLVSLTGEIQQQVPKFSAVKIDGERLHKKARRGEEVALPVRTVHIHELELISYASPRVQIRARVSKGTYIRSLAVQIGQALGVPAHLCALRRTQVGPHVIGEAALMARFSEPQPPIVSARAALKHLPELVIPERFAEHIACGRVLQPSQLQQLSPTGALQRGDIFRISSHEGGLLALGECLRSWSAASEEAPSQPFYKYACVLIRPEDLTAKPEPLQDRQD